MIKKFLIFLFVFCFLLRISPEVLANIPKLKIIPLPSGVFNTPTPTPTSAPIIKPRVTTVVLPPTTTASPTATPTQVPTQEVLTSSTPRPTPTPAVSLPPTSLPSTNVWQLTTIGLVAAIAGGLITALLLRRGGKGKQQEKEG